jgi:hypothetical protein
MNSFSAVIIRWFREYGRDLPWRETKDPYTIWLSEIIPAPAFTQQISILQRAVGIDAATDGVNTHILQTIDKCRHIIAVETGIHTAYTIDITRQHPILNGTGIFQSGLSGERGIRRNLFPSKCNIERHPV